MNLVAALRAFFAQHGVERTYWLAYSGGLDSHVLLRLCQLLRDECALQLHAIHINHSLSPHAAEWSRHCAHTCKDAGIAYSERMIQIDRNPGESLEEVAREQRYAMFAACLKPNDMLLTAHQQDDQAETMLLQLLRGSGLKGLAAMPVVKPFAQGFLGRPLLAFPRASLEYFAKEQQLQWVEDESNRNVALTRNFMRHAILPLLKNRWPSITATFARTAQHCAEAQVLLEDFSLSICENMYGSQANTLSVQKILRLPVEQQRLILRTWVQRLGFLLPDAKKLHTIVHTVLTAEPDRMPLVSWEGVEVRRYQDDLYLQASLSAHEPTQALSWQLDTPLPVSGLGILQATKVLGHGLRATIQTATVRFRQGGEKIELPKRGRHTLKNLFQEWQIPPWLRDRIPLVYVNEQLVAVVGHFLHADYVAEQGEAGWDITVLIPTLRKDDNLTSSHGKFCNLDSK